MEGGKRFSPNAEIPTDREGRGITRCVHAVEAKLGKWPEGPEGSCSLATSHDPSVRCADTSPRRREEEGGRVKKKERAFRPLFPFVEVGLRLEAQVDTQEDNPRVAADGIGRAAGLVVHRTADRLDARSERVVGTDFPLGNRLGAEQNGR